MWEKYRLVFTVSIHPDLGNLIEANAVLLNQDGSFSMTSTKVNPNSIDPSKYEINETEIQIIKIIDEYHEESIVEKFAKKSSRYQEFLLKECSEDLMLKHIRPYIERRLLKIIGLLSDNKIPLYFRGDRNNFIYEKPLKINISPTAVVFNFVRAELEIRYFLTILDQNEILSLFDQQAYILTNEPAWIIINNQIFTFESNFDSKKLKPFFTKKYVSIAKEFEEKYFKSFIYNSVKSYKNVNAVGFEIEEIHLPPTPRLKLEKDWQQIAVLKLEFKYGKVKFDLNSPDQNHLKLIFGSEEIVFIKTHRDFEQENTFVDILTGLGLERKDGSTFYLNVTNADNNESVLDLINWLNEHKETLIEKGFDIVEDIDKKKYFTGKIEIQQFVKEQNDWFDLNVIVSFGNFKIPFHILKRHILFGKREYKLPDGQIAVLPEEWFSKYQDIALFSKTNRDEIRIDKKHFQAFENGISKKAQPNIEFKRISDVDSIELPEYLQADLRPYQKIGYEWLKFLGENDLGACLADDMGLGKTVQTLAILQKESNKNKELNKETDNSENVQLDLFTFSHQNMAIKPSLIVMPTSLVYNWVKEIQKFTPELKWMVHSGYRRLKKNSTFKYFDLIITTYGIIRNDLKLLKEVDFNYIVLDESQNIKNPDSKIFKAVSQLQSEKKLILTGTPIENTLLDLWAQMSFINPDLLGSQKYFKNEFINPIEKAQNSLQQEKLKKLIGPFILRRTKEEVAKDLPDLMQDIRYCEMTEEQATYYTKRKSEIRNLLLDDIKNFGVEQKMIAVLKALMQLRLAANHPLLIDSGFDGNSGKFDEVLSQIENIISGGHKILIFSSFVKHLNLFKEHFEKNSFKYKMLIGSTPMVERQKIVEGFQNDDDVKIFLISIKAGGVGLNLTAADYVFVLDPWWNPAVEFQAINRAHRIGQDKKVFSYKFITKDTIEEKILMLQEKKKLLADEFVNSNNPLKLLSHNDIENLFD